MLFGQLMMRQYAPDPAISFAAIGDATCGDRAPLQICDFAAGGDLDQWITKLWLEEGGGGTGQESYELAAFYYMRQARLTPGKKGLFFISGDENYYGMCAKDQARTILGIPAEEDIDSRFIFERLQQKFDVFFLFPIKGAEARKKDIDAELAARLAREGARSGAITISLMWNNRDDLDLHCICPDGSHIYYGNRNACGGMLDVDMNAGGACSDTPVENIFFNDGAPLGQYRIQVHNFTHRVPGPATPFKVCLQINGNVQEFTGAADNKQLIEVHSFKYEGKTSPEAEQQKYAGYDNDTIIRSWERVIPSNHILTFTDPKAIVDIMLGCVALTLHTRDLQGYINDLIERGQSEERQVMVRECLTKLLAGPVPPPPATATN